MPPNKPTRKQRFRVALSVEGITAEQWAERNGISPQYLSMILSGKRAPDTVVARIDRYVVKQLSKQQTALAS